MMGKRKLWGIMFIITALVIMQLPVSEADAATSSASDFQMKGSTLVKYAGTETTVNVPNTVEVIGESAFEENDTIQKIVLPDSVKQIEAYAFWGCDRLSTVTLGKGLTEIGDYVFTNCKGLKQMTIPSNIRSIGIQSFADCVNMTDITIPPEVTSIHDTSFDGCYRLVIHAEMGSTADKYAEEFAGRQEEMPEYEDVSNYPNTDTDDNSSEEDKPQDTEQPGNIVEEGSLLGSTKIVGNQAVVFIDNTSPTVIGGISESTSARPEDTAENSSDNLLENNSDNGGLSKYTIVDGKIVADQAYYRSRSLSEVTLAAGIEEIGQFSFARSSVSRINIPEGVKSIGYGAFYHCEALADIALPATIETVEPKAFAHTLWMERFLESGEVWLTSGNVLVAYNGQESRVEIPEGITVIAAEAFRGNTQIEEVIFPDSLHVIGEDAFVNCSSLKEITLGANVQKIKDRAFLGCALEKVVLPASVQEMGLQVYGNSVTVEYQGETPQVTHENTAERLSNEDYRDVTPETLEPGVVVSGIEGGYAQLEGALRNYALEIAPDNDSDSTAAMQRAYQRIYGTDLPESAVCYRMRFMDNSTIPLTKLGRQNLVIRIPVPDSLQSENIAVVALDRNGQLEKLPSERTLMDGKDYVKFATSRPADFAVYGDGTAFDNSTAIVEESVTFSSMSANPGAGPSNVRTGEISLGKALVLLQWMVGLSLLLLGLGCIFYKKK